MRDGSEAPVLATFHDGLEFNRSCGSDLFVRILRQAARIERLRLFYGISPNFDASHYGIRTSPV